MKQFEEEYKKRFADAQSTEGIDAENLWEEIEAALPDAPQGAAPKRKFPFWLLAFFMLVPVAVFYFYKKSPQPITKIEQKKETTTALQADNQLIENKALKEKNNIEITQNQIDDSVDQINIDTNKPYTNKTSENTEKPKQSHLENRKAAQAASALNTANQKAPTEATSASFFEKNKATSKHEFKAILDKNEVFIAKNDKKQANIAQNTSNSEQSTPQTLSPATQFSQRTNSTFLENKQPTTESSEVQKNTFQNPISDTFSQTENSINQSTHKPNQPINQLPNLPINPITKSKQSTNQLNIPNQLNQLIEPIQPNKRFKIGLLAGPNLMSLPFKTAADISNSSTGLQVGNTAQGGSSAALELHFNPKPNIEISTGIEYSSSHNQFDFVRQWDTTMYRDHNPSLDIIKAQSTRTVRHRNSFTTLSIPILVGMSKQSGRFGYGAAAGIGLHFFLSQKGKSLNAAGQITEFDQAANTALPFNTRFISYQIKPFVAYRCTADFELRMQPVLRMQQSDSDFYGVQQRAVVGELRIGGMWRF